MSFMILLWLTIDVLEGIYLTGRAILSCSDTTWKFLVFMSLNSPGFLYCYKLKVKSALIYIKVAATFRIITPISNAETNSHFLLYRIIDFSTKTRAPIAIALPSTAYTQNIPN